MPQGPPQQQPAQSGTPQCPFCQLVANPEQTFDVHETEHFKAWLDINPRAKGHTMIVPKEHLTGMDDLGELAPELFEMIRIVMEKAKNGLDADGVSVVLNEGEAGGQNLEHFYAQVFPRFEGEENAGAPAGAVFQQRDDIDESDLDEISSAMASASYPEFDTAIEGAASDVIAANRQNAAKARRHSDAGEEDTGKRQDEDRDEDEADDDDERDRSHGGSWDGESYHWDNAEFK